MVEWLTSFATHAKSQTESSQRIATSQKDCKVAFFTAKNAKNAKEMLTMDIS